MEWIRQNIGLLQLAVLVYIAARIESLPTAKQVARFADLIMEHMTRLSLASERSPRV